MKKHALTFMIAIVAGTSIASAQTGNTTVGTNAGVSITDGDDNTLVGENAGQTLNTGSKNVFIGKDAGMLFDGSMDIICIGWMAAAMSTAGRENIFIGSETGLVNTGSDNIFIGSRAGKNNTTGLDNTFIGEEAGLSNTTGRHNTFVGEDAGRSNTEGDDNTAMGDSALHQCTTGSGNTAIGNDAAYDLDTGIRNTVLGDLTGTDLDTGNFNTFLGSRAGEHTEDGDYNTFVGTLAGMDNNRSLGQNNSHRNTYLGAGTGIANRDGSDNVALGAFADFGRWRSTEQELFDGFTATWGIRPDGSPGGINASRTVMVGASAVVGSDDAIGIGFEAVSTRPRAITIGATASTAHNDAITIGYGAISHADATVVIGNDTTIGWHPGTDAVTELGNPAYRFTGVTAQRFDVIAGSSTPADIELWADDGTDNDDKWRISAANGGNLTIGSFANGSEYVAKLTIANTGDVTIPGEISINSDARLKNDVRPIADALDRITRIEGRTYTWKEGLGRDQRRHYGLIAQQVESVIPELVTESDDGTKSVNYQALVPVLVEAMKDLRQSKDAEIQTLRKNNADLADRVARLESLIGKHSNK